MVTTCTRITADALCNVQGHQGCDTTERTSFLEIMEKFEL